MKLYVLSILLLIACSQIGKEVTPCLERVKLVKKTADFREIYKKVLEREGYYVFHFSDAGGETYRGIARNYSKDWLGWQYIDFYKKTHKLNWNDSIPGNMLKWHILDYYLTIFCSEKFMYIEDQMICEYVYDFRINSSFLGVKTIQKTLNEIGYPTEISGYMDMETVNNINKCPKWEFMAKLMSNRVEYYTSIVNKYPSQRVFYSHWISRTQLK